VAQLAWPAHTTAHGRAHVRGDHHAQHWPGGATGGRLPEAPVRRGQRREHVGAKAVAPGIGRRVGAHLRSGAVWRQCFGPWVTTFNRGGGEWLPAVTRAGFLQVEE
jgi:hypothetical protein